MEEKEVVVDSKSIKIVTKLPKDNYEINNLNLYLEDTIDLENIVKDINNNEEKWRENIIF